ncbi:Hypothetical protein BN69_1536 [Methylocystis sp. SC2]|nr:Hypothetical protein BN69_1536 [Methylocystis sp. SC2]
MLFHGRRNAEETQGGASSNARSGIKMDYALDAERASCEAQLCLRQLMLGLLQICVGKRFIVALERAAARPKSSAMSTRFVG